MLLTNKLDNSQIKKNINFKIKYDYGSKIIYRIDIDFY